MSAPSNPRGWFAILLIIATGSIVSHTYAAESAAGIRVSDVTLFGDMDCLRIETSSATYLYGKRGAGFASIIDPVGHDWIAYRHGGQALGEYRGLPKCGQPAKYFHCGYGFGQYTNNNPFTTTVTLRESTHVRVHSETEKKDAACDWDFFPNYATLTLLKIPGHYWFLYEGVPGGALDVTEDFVVRPGGRKTPLTEPWTDSVPWVCFGAKESTHGLLLLNHQKPEPNETDSYVSWPYKPDKNGGLNQMTVFGFGRPSWTDPKQHTPPLKVLPARFSISIVPGTKSEQINDRLNEVNGRQP